MPLPEAALQQLAASHGVRARLLASVGGGPFGVRVPLRSGEVRVDGTGAVRRTLRAQVVARLDDPAVSPVLAEWQAQYAVVAPNGTEHWTTVGTFVPTRVRQVGDNLCELEGGDRWVRVQRARFIRPVTTSGSTAAAIIALLQGADQRISASNATGVAGSHNVSLWERDRDKAVTDLARSLGAQVAFTPEGAAVIRPVASLTDPVRWQVGGGAGGVKVGQAQLSVDTERTYNAVSVAGEPDGLPPVYAAAYNLDVRSPTYYGGPFGTKPRFYASQLITTTAQAQATANALLAQAIGVPRSLTMEALPNPDLEPGDVLLCEVSAGRWERHLLDSYTLPLGPGTIGLATRTVAAEDAAA